MKNTTSTALQANRLIFLGFFLFLLGLLIGFGIPVFKNPRMGLSAHLEGTMNGMFLIILGLVWHKLALSQNQLKIAYSLCIYGSFANFLAVSIGAISGAGKMMPIAGGKEGHPILETIISFLLISLALAMVAVCVLVLKGLYAQNKNSTSETAN